MSEDTQISFSEFQSLIRTMYMEKDVERGIDGTFMWLMEEVGELAAALRSGSEDDKSEEFADVLAWLTTIANVAGIDLNDAIRRKYGDGCPGCRQYVCQCSNSEKP
ncbi:MAG: nucleotide pyrophosphohydrolase [Planctomycetaceae bacterium]|nr:nucleotide pyrophosphohydrolase [Planctomycetaceae bacterium]|tara:strand:- start:158 stop:475 length:318 start_codon:yes stop_codon:yes gene_type:complete